MFTRHSTIAPRSRRTVTAVAVAVSLAATTAGTFAMRSAGALASAASATTQASMTVLAQSEHALEMQFTDGTGASVTIEFTRENLHAPWIPVAPLQTERGFAFGNQSPRLPTLARLRERDLDPALVVRPFEPDFCIGDIDDLTIYQLEDRQIVVAVHNDGLVVSVGYAGHFAHAVWFTVPRIERVCQALLTLCCDGTGAPPTPDLTSCRNVIRYCSQQLRDEVCVCILNWCEQNPPIGAACNLWITCCWGNECDLPPDDPVDVLMQTVVDLLQYHLDARP
jgi:hypothetical protein